MLIFITHVTFWCILNTTFQVTLWESLSFQKSKKEAYYGGLFEHIFSVYGKHYTFFQWRKRKKDCFFWWTIRTRLFKDSNQAENLREKNTITPLHILFQTWFFMRHVLMIILLCWREKKYSIIYIAHIPLLQNTMAIHSFHWLFVVFC